MQREQSTFVTETSGTQGPGTYIDVLKTIEIIETGKKRLIRGLKYAYYLYIDKVFCLTLNMSKISVSVKAIMLVPSPPYSEDFRIGDDMVSPFINPSFVTHWEE